MRGRGSFASHFSGTPSRYRSGSSAVVCAPKRYWTASISVGRRSPSAGSLAFLRETGRLDDEAADALSARVESRIDEAIAAAEAASDDPHMLFEHVFEEPTPGLRRQRERLDQLREAHGDAAIGSER